MFGFGERWVWALVFGAISLGLGLLGPIGFIRRYLRKFAVWAVSASIVYLTWWALDEVAPPPALATPGGEGGFPLRPGNRPRARRASSPGRRSPPTTRASRATGAARSWGTGCRLPRPTLWCFGLGTLLVLSRGISATRTQIPTVVATGSVLAVIALLTLTVDESDEAFADIYSTAVSIQNILPRVSQRLLIALVAATATAGAIAIDLGNYPTFLYLLGSVFVPLFGVLLADWLDTRRALRGGGHLRGAGRRIERLVAWVAGFALYQWLSPVGPSWWTDLVEHPSPGTHA